MKPGHLNAGLDHLSQIEIGEEPTNTEDGFAEVQLFRVEMVEKFYEKIVHFLVIGTTP